MTIMSDSNSKIEAVLTADQKPKFEAMQQSGRQRKSRTTGSGGTTSPSSSTQPPQQ
jgi:hypothetical protein